MGHIIKPAIALCILAACWFGCYPWLARTAPIPSEVLVIEGWLSDQQLADAMAWASTNGVKRIYATGLPFEIGSMLLPWKDGAHMTRERMKIISAQQGYTFTLGAAPGKAVQRNRTQASAKAFKQLYGMSLKDFNLASGGTHTRRSWRIYRDYFRPDVKVGSLALTPTTHNQKDWWKTSEGVRVVVGEVIAYAYDLFAGSRE